MGRLIDADEFYKEYCRLYENVASEDEMERVAYMVYSQPTAYDVEKVVAELENEDNHLTYGGIPFKEPPIKVSDAIDIVRKGGIDG